MPFDSTGKADHCAALRLIRAEGTAEGTAVDAEADDCTADQQVDGADQQVDGADQHKPDHRPQVETDSGTAKVAAGIAVHG